MGDYFRSFIFLIEHKDLIIQKYCVSLIESTSHINSVIRLASLTYFIVIFIQDDCPLAIWGAADPISHTNNYSLRFFRLIQFRIILFSPIYRVLYLLFSLNLLLFPFTSLQINRILAAIKNKTILVVCDMNCLFRFEVYSYRVARVIIVQKAGCVIIINSDVRPNS